MVIDEQETHPEVTTRQDVPVVYHPVESNALTNMAATLASLSAIVRRIDSETKNDPAAMQETL